MYKYIYILSRYWIMCPFVFLLAWFPEFWDRASLLVKTGDKKGNNKSVFKATLLLDITTQPETTETCIELENYFWTQFHNITISAWFCKCTRFLHTIKYKQMQLENVKKGGKKSRFFVYWAVLGQNIVLYHKKEIWNNDEVLSLLINDLFKVVEFSWLPFSFLNRS